MPDALGPECFSASSNIFAMSFIECAVVAATTTEEVPEDPPVAPFFNALKLSNSSKVFTISAAFATLVSVAY